MESSINVVKGLSDYLKSTQQGANEQSEEIAKAAQKFEAFFIQSMLKSMRTASLSTGLLDSDKSDFYQEWHDQQLATDLASQETFAVAKLLRGQFIGNTDPSIESSSLQPDALFRRSAYSSSAVSSEGSTPTTVVASIEAPKINAIDSFKTTLKQLVTKEIDENIEITNNKNLSIPEQFVTLVYPHAEQAATKLNVSADVLVAIAALETGWGLHTPQAKLGKDSFNYFGIKANNWQGPEVSNVTKEFDGEKMIKIQDNFRAYDTPAESFNDFAEFLLSNPRYQDAINNRADANVFVNELQKAGYATDPNYAKKVNSILNGSILNNAIHSLNTSTSASETTGDVVSSFETNKTH
ncbi:MAG: flagellar assembly peptidoglycan hydrolase FlgJ [Gammaproteobacteria bacterium]